MACTQKQRAWNNAGWATCKCGRKTTNLRVHLNRDHKDWYQQHLPKRFDTVKTGMTAHKDGSNNTNINKHSSSE